MARGTVAAADGDKPMREVQVRLLADEIRDDVEHVEPYGFTSEPLKDGLPEAFALFFDGDRSHGIVFCVADRRYRLKSLQAGEVAIYDDLGQKVHLTRTGIEIVTPKHLRATVGGNVSAVVSGDVSETVGGSLQATISGSASIKAASVLVDAPSTHITGTLTVDGLITGKGGMAVSGGSGASVSGNMKVSGGDVTADSISLKNHTHPGDSGGTTGPAQ